MRAVSMAASTVVLWGQSKDVETVVSMAVSMVEMTVAKKVVWRAE